ncbi:MAG: glycoside hydrolase family 127 protein [Verrucomicrobiota bacterium]|nr:glycoside hydrolase family 127 protein [Limisphaera sp.]MDW8380764.1 glycoside hydrolase family 127 protein [Verrucomicrobiota bacterium]
MGRVRRAHLLTALLEHGQVHRVANVKAYVMRSNLVGLSELHRIPGESKYLRTVLMAWQDIVERWLYITGGTNQGGYFREDYFLPNPKGTHIAETCVTVTWLQMNLQLLQLTGEPRFVDKVERTTYTHPFADQYPTGERWCYLTPLKGRRAHGPGINCCVSSSRSPRGITWAPTFSYGVTRFPHCAAPAVLMFECSRVQLRMGQRAIELIHTSYFPAQGFSRLCLRMKAPRRFPLCVRAPEWALPLEAQIPGLRLMRQTQPGWRVLPQRLWRDGDTVKLRYGLGPRLIRGRYGNTGPATLRWGPFVLAYDRGRNVEGAIASAVGSVEPFQVACVVDPHAGLILQTGSLRTRYGVRGVFKLVPSADAGAASGDYQVWRSGPDPGWRSSVNREHRGKPSEVQQSTLLRPPAILLGYSPAKPFRYFWISPSEPLWCVVLAFRLMGTNQLKTSVYGQS